jgi:hypothetical protein
MDLQVEFYTGKYDVSQDSFTWTSLERTMNNGDKIKYRKMEGLEDVGKIKNLYVETYADSNIQRVDFPDTIARENTKIKLDLIILRNNTRTQSSTYQDLVDYFSNGLTVYWDTQRKRTAILFFESASQPTTDTYLGTPYMEVELEFTNVTGVCPIINDTYTSSHLPLVEAYSKPIILSALS